MNSKLRWLAKTNKTTFSKKVNPIKSPVQKFVVQYQKHFYFSQNYSVPFHWITFDHSILCALLKDKQNESCQSSKNLKEMPLSTIKKLLKRKWNSITPAKTIAAISQTSSEHLKLTIQT